MKALFYCILPALIFTFSYEIIYSAAVILIRTFVQNGSDSVYAMFMANEVNIDTALIGITMIPALFAVMRPLKEQIITIRLTQGLAGNKYRGNSEEERLPLIEYAAMVTGCISLSVVMNVITGMRGVLYSRQSMPAVLLSVAVYVLAAPAVEELVFRIMTYGRLKAFFLRDLPRWKAAALSAAFSSLLFGLYHGNISQGAYAFFMGLLFCAAYEYANKISVPVILHAAANLTTIIMAGRSGEYEMSQLTAGIGVFAVCCVVLWFSVKKRRI